MGKAADKSRQVVPPLGLVYAGWPLLIVTMRHLAAAPTQQKQPCPSLPNRTRLPWAIKLQARPSAPAPAHLSFSISFFIRSASFSLPLDPWEALFSCWFSLVVSSLYLRLWHRREGEREKKGGGSLGGARRNGFGAEMGRSCKLRGEQCSKGSPYSPGSSLSYPAPQCRKNGGA